MIFLLFIFIFGLIVGSFINVVILRYNTGKTIGGRSQCFSCGKTILWYELIPLFSYVFLKGRCSKCKSGISMQYPLVEFASGLIFVFLFIKIFSSFDVYSISDIRLLMYCLSLLLWLSLLIIFVYDIRHKIIPDLFSLLFFTSALFLSCIISYTINNINYLLNGVYGSMILGFFFFLLWFFSKGRAMGFGDVKLVLGMGMYLGVALGLSAVAFAFWIGASYAVITILIQRTNFLGINNFSKNGKIITMKSEVPFAPFLIIGVIIVSIWQVDIFSVGFFMNI